MDPDLHKSKPPSTSYRETFRRHRRLFCLPILLGALAAAVFVFGMGKTYKSTASLWVDTSPPVASSVGANTGSALAEPPAASEQAILSELLTTRAFVAAVARNSLLGKSLDSADAVQAKAMEALGAGQVVATVPGGQVLQIGYSASSPAMAQSVLGAVVAQLRNYTKRQTAQHSQETITYAKQQVKDAQTALATARNNVTAYRAHHPGASQDDPNYVTLVGAENNAVTQLAQANTDLGQSGTADSWSIQVIDAPSQASAAPLRKSKIAEVIFGGMLGGLLVSFLAVVALTPAKKEAWEDELEIGGPLFPDVAPADLFPTGSPGVPPQSTSATAAAQQHGRSLGDWRPQSRIRSGRTEEK